jgi:hypothetical protein
MKARDLVFIAIVLFVLGGLYFLSTKGRAKPVPPTPPEHLQAKTREECLACHRPEQMSALELAHKHPGKWRDARVSCFRCHAEARSSALIRSTETFVSALIARPDGSREKSWHKPERN